MEAFGPGAEGRPPGVSGAARARRAPEPSGGGGAAGHAHLGEDLPDGVEDAADLALPEAADASDTEAVGHRELAGIDHVAPASQPVVEDLEVEGGIGGHAHGDDDGGLEGIGKEGLEP